jgi:hypothetical protein
MTGGRTLIAGLSHIHETDIQFNEFLTLFAHVHLLVSLYVFLLTLNMPVF